MSEKKAAELTKKYKLSQEMIRCLKFMECSETGLLCRYRVIGGEFWEGPSLKYGEIISAFWPMTVYALLKRGLIEYTDDSAVCVVSELFVREMTTPKLAIVK